MRNIHMFYGDLCHCNWCNEDVIVQVGEDVCPMCDKEGYLMDIKQNISICVDVSTRC